MANSVRKWLGLGNLRLTVQDWSLLLLPFMLFFSYHPVISFGSGDYKTHYELSLLEIYLVIFVVLNLPGVWKQRRTIFSHTAAFVVLLFGVYNTLSLFWTPNLIRGILTAGIVWLLVGCFFAVMANQHFSKLVQPLFKLLVASALLFSLFAWYQLVAGTHPALANWTLLCDGCKATQFGFARPNAFMAEPQFFGSLLVVPISLLAHLMITARRSFTVHLAFVNLVFTLVLTLSRGALLSLIAGGSVLLFINKKHARRFIIPVSFGSLALFTAFAAQGIAAQLNPTLSTSFSEAVTASIHQLSMGKIDLRTKNTVSETATTKTQPVVFDGYVKRSTSERMTSSCLALNTWTAMPTHIVFGVGLGGTGYYFEQQPARSVTPWCKTNT